MRNRILGATLGITVALTACGGDEGSPEPPEPAEQAQQPTEAEEVIEQVGDVLDDVLGVEEPEQVAFDPDAEIDPREIEVTELGVDGVQRPFELMLVPDGLVLPATAQLVTWNAIEEPFRDEPYGGLGTRTAFRLHEADPEAVKGFFVDRLGSHDWELERDEQHGDAWNQRWVTRIPWDGWTEEWKFDERAVEVQVELYYIPGEAGRTTLQFAYGATDVRHRWDD